MKHLANYMMFSSFLYQFHQRSDLFVLYLIYCNMLYTLIINLIGKQERKLTVNFVGVELLGTGRGNELQSLVLAKRNRKFCCKRT